jgi:glycosyltransferase involved in cell wall biosynthesis
MKVRAYTRYARMGASSRVRLYQYLPSLRSLGIEVDVRPLLDDSYLRARYIGEMPWQRVAGAYLSRSRDLIARPDAIDAIWIEKELWPWAPAWLERLVSRGTPMVLDLDDAIFHNYDRHPSALVRRLYSDKIDQVMRSAALVTAGNEYLAERATAAGARRVEILPTVIDLDRYGSAKRPVQNGPGPFRICWIGSPATIGYLQSLSQALAFLAREMPICLRLIGATLELPGVPIETVAWAESTEVQAIAECDVGLMPLPDSPWERGKCGYKLIQYSACGLPVVASPVGANVRIVQPGVSGFLATNSIEWANALRALAGDAAMRQRMGDAGRARVAKEFSLQAAAPRLAHWLSAVAGHPIPGMGV